MKMNHLLTALCIALGLTSCITNYEVPTMDKGMLGIDIEWTLDYETKVLTFYGGGCISATEYYSEGRILEWHRDHVKKIIISGDKFNKIGEKAFANYSNVESVEIPSSVSIIDPDAFSECHSLKSITIPPTVEEISVNTFYNCGFSSIIIPKSVKAIGAFAFSGCESLVSVTCEAITPPTTSGNSPFSKPWNIDLYVPENSVNAYKDAEYWKEFKSISAIH